MYTPLHTRMPTQSFSKQATSRNSVYRGSGEKTQKKLNTSLLISPKVLSVNMRRQHISAPPNTLRLQDVCSQQQVLLSAEVHLWSLLFPSHPAPQLQRGRLSICSSSNPCFVLPEHSFAGSQKVFSTHTAQFPFPEKMGGRFTPFLPAGLSPAPQRA